MVAAVAVAADTPVAVEAVEAVDGPAAEGAEVAPVAVVVIQVVVVADTPAAAEATVAVATVAAALAVAEVEVVVVVEVAGAETAVVALAVAVGTAAVVVAETTGKAGIRCEYFARKHSVQFKTGPACAGPFLSEHQSGLAAAALVSWAVASIWTDTSALRPDDRSKAATECSFDKRGKTIIAPARSKREPTMDSTKTRSLGEHGASAMPRLLALQTTANHWKRFTALAAALLSASHATAQTVGWWRFDEAPAGSMAALPASIIDLAAANNGTPFGAPVYTAALDGCTTGGLVFDGVNSRVAVPDSAAYANLRSISIEVELVTSGYRPTPFGLNQIIFRGDDRGGLDPFFLAIQSDGRIGFFVNNVLLVQSPSPVPAGVLTHVAATLDDSSGAVKLFVDRALLATATTLQRPNATALTGPNPGVGIGNLQSGNFVQPFAGTIYEVRLSATALPIDAMLPVRPRITSGPAGIEVCSNATAVFSAAASGSAPLMYQWQWQHAGAPGIWTNMVEGPNEDSTSGGGGLIRFIASGAAGPSVAMTSSANPQGSLAVVQSVRCIVTNACGTVMSNAATLTVGSCGGCSLADIAGDGGNGLSPDGIVDGSDFIAFINSFGTGDVATDPLADVAGGGGDGLLPDGIIDGSDFITFINAFAAGC